MPEIFQTFLSSVGLLFGLTAAGFLIFKFVTLSIKKTGRLSRGLNLELFLILIPQDEYTEPGQQNLKNDRERVQTMEQLYTIFSNMVEKGSWRIFEFGQPYLVWEIVYIDNEIRFYAAVPTRYRETLIRAVHSVSSEAVVEPVQDYNIFTPSDAAGGVAAAYVMTSRNSILPIKTYQMLDVDPLNELGTHFSKLNPGENA